MNATEAKTILDMLASYASLSRKVRDETTWVALKLRCTVERAAMRIAAARKWLDEQEATRTEGE